MESIFVTSSVNNDSGCYGGSVITMGDDKDDKLSICTN